METYTSHVTNKDDHGSVCLIRLHSTAFSSFIKGKTRSTVYLVFTIIPLPTTDTTPSGAYYCH